MPLMLALTAAAAITAPSPDAPMTPSGKWNVDYGASACTLGRVYGTGKTETTLVLRRVPLASTLDLMISTTDRNAAMRLGQATLSVGGPRAVGTSTQSRYESYPTQSPGKRMMRTPVDVEMFDMLPADAVLRVAPDKGPGWAFILPSGKAAFEALATCNDSTAKLWGVDPAERTRIAQPAKPRTSPEYWITPADYPRTVASSGAQGTSTILWTIGIDGRSTDCRTVVTSGEVELDKAACSAIIARARYTPALGFDGKPVLSHITRKVAWRLTGAWSGG